MTGKCPRLLTAITSPASGILASSVIENTKNYKKLQKKFSNNFIAPYNQTQGASL
jgi:hypothetical protein